jgi:hypothetical protein
MGEVPSKGPGGSLKNLIDKAERIILDRSLQSLSTSSRVEQVKFDFEAEMGSLLAGLALAAEEKGADDHDIHEICGLLFELTENRKGEVERFPEYIERLRKLRLTNATRTQVGATVGSSVRSPVPATVALPARRTTPPAPARVTTASPVPATAVIPGRVNPTSRPSVPSPTPDTSPATRRVSPSPDGRIQVLVGGTRVPLTRTRPTPPTPTRPTAVNQVPSTTISTPPAPRPVPAATASVPARPATAIQNRVLPQLQPENLPMPIIKRELRDSVTRRVRIDEIMRAKKPGDAQSAKDGE